MIDILIILVLLVLIGGAGVYVHRARKSGQKCIGCPNAKACQGGCPSQCGCKPE